MSSFSFSCFHFARFYLPPTLRTDIVRLADSGHLIIFYFCCKSPLFGLAELRVAIFLIFLQKIKDDLISGNINVRTVVVTY